MKRKLPDMARHIRESNLIESIDDPAEDARSLRAFKWFMGQHGISTGVILEVHRRITLKQLPFRQRGNWRTIQVYVGDHIPPPPVLVIPQISEYLDELRFNWHMIDPIKAHVRFETIHPFVDGNGRTGRMLLWWHQIKRGEDPTLFLNVEKRSQYYPLFKRDV
jgi:Fic family protein